MAAPKLSKMDRETTGLKLFPLFSLLGWILIGFSVLVSVLLLAPTAASYWGGNAKALRDAAEIGSPLLGALTTLAWWPKLLIPLTFLGVASFMLGIAMEFAAIPRILDRRIELLTQAVPLMGNK
jgi:hypothetical protein